MNVTKTYNSEVTIKTLRAVVNILDKHKIKYRFLGSIIPAALNKSLHRKINDLDLLVDIEKEKIFMEKIRLLGLHRKIKNHMRFSELLNLHIFQGNGWLETTFSE